ncbi:hypothetical protein BO71DRAFT_188815 [Aspergillus ellipticus CBS 707.79]|uniref:Uncharacterized protein n=1 Tax=Aspergillus ellipticus CBS 707.79 TaxID=1448320 RepID=A0A319DF56_9EURO|nr:hypothetical protein BO71DRAFT_188815 [Aspergillus ellipticus CBS 707.79]
MHSNLDNISFYQPPPSKLSQPTASSWKLYNTPPVPQALSHPLPPKPPTPITNILISGKQPTAVQQSRGPTKEDENSAAAGFCNTFDIELERVSLAENQLIVREAHALDIPQYQRLSSTAVLYSVSFESVQPLAGADDGEDIIFKPAVKQHTLRKQSNNQTQPPGGTVCYSSLSLILSDLDDSVPLVATTDSVGFRQESILLSVTCTETDKTTPPGAGTPSLYNSRSPSPGLLDNIPYLRSVSPAETSQCDKVIIKDTSTEAAACRD